MFVDSEHFNINGMVSEVSGILPSMFWFSFCVLVQKTSIAFE